MRTERPLHNENRSRAESFLADSSIKLNLNIDNPFLFVRTGLIAKLLFMKEIYEEIIDTPGNIVEVGCWFGQSSVIFENLRAILEPFNCSRRIVSFDTFNGYVETSGLKIKNEEIEKYRALDDWIGSLGDIQESHKIINNSVTNFTNIKGDIFQTIPDFISKNMEPIAMIYYDIATYNTLKLTFETLVPFLVKGGLFVFDDYGHPYEGVNRFLIENNLIKKYKLTHSKYYKSKVYLRIE